MRLKGRVRVKIKKFQMRKGVLWGWIKSYIVIMLIPLLFGVVLYTIALNNIKNETQIIREQSMMGLSRTLENMVENFTRVSYALSSGAYNAGVYTRTISENGYNNPMSVVQLQAMMRSYSVANDSISNLYMYFPENDYLLMENLTYKYDRIKDYSEKYLGITKRDFDEILNADHNGCFLVLNKNIMPKIYYVYNGKSYHNKIIVFMPLNMETLKNLINVDSETDIFLQIKTDKILIVGKDQEFPVDFRDSSHINQVFSYEDEQLYWMSQPFDGENNLLISCVDVSIYFQTLHKMRLLLIGYLLISLIIGGWIAGYYSKQHYTPVKTLMQQIEEKPKDQGNEYQMISDYYMKIKEKYKDSVKKLHQQKDVVRNNYLRKALRAENKAAFDKYWQCLDTSGNFYKGNYIVVGAITGIKNSETFTDANIDGELLDVFIVNNILSEILSEKYLLVSGEVDGFLLYVVSLNDSKSNEDKLVQQIDYALYYIEQFYQIPVTVNLSRISQDIYMLNRSFEEVKEIQEYRDISKKDELKVRRASRLYFPEEDEKEKVEQYHQYLKMSALMKQHEYGQVKEILEKMLDGQNDKMLRENKGVKKTRMVNEIVDYIEEHYDDWQLSGKMFADKYQVSVSYLSQIFKREKGIGLLDYVNQVRYKKAKILLDKGMSVQEIAQRVGFATTQPLRRVFLQFEGVTPSQSRKNQKKEEGEMTDDQK